jgi:hypothetical protein
MYYGNDINIWLGIDYVFFNLGYPQSESQVENSNKEKLNLYLDLCNNKHAFGLVFRV